MLQVTATVPFQIISSLVFCFVVYGMSGLRHGAQFIFMNGCLSTLLSLIAVQVWPSTARHAYHSTCLGRCSVCFSFVS